MVPRIKELDEIPSQNLTGLMDKFFDGKLIPVIQTTRGCPFSCNFCVESDSYYSKIQSFQTQYAIDKSWLDYVTSIAAGVDPAVYDATAYCPPFCEGHLGYPYLYYASYTEYNEQEETSLYGQFDYNVNEKFSSLI